MKTKQLCIFIVGLGLCCVAIGCGNPNGTVRVSGVVTVDGSPPPGEGTITFTTVEPAEGFPNRPAMAKFGTDGEYVTTSYEPGDGLIPGTYKVAVECYATPPNMEGKPIKSHINKKYMNGETSGFELKVEPGARPIKFDLALEE